MKRVSYVGLAAIICFSAALLLTSGCGKKKDPGRVIAVVNGENIYQKDLDRALQRFTSRDPLYRITPRIIEDQVSMMIDKKILIQEAKKNKLDETDKFLVTIKNFWEQTLIRDLVEYKETQLQSGMEVPENDIRSYYDRMRFQITFWVLREKDMAQAEKQLTSAPDTIKWDEKIGPITLEDASSELIARVFDLPEKEVKVLKDENYYYVVYVSAKEEIPVKPYEEIRENIINKIRNQKLQGEFKKWLTIMKASAKIKINQDQLKEIEKENGK